MTANEKNEMIQEMFERVNNEIDIEDVVSSHLDKRGSNYKCPFHSESTVGAFSINKQQNYFFCFGCGIGGSAISFIERYKGMTYFDACKELALNSGILSSDNYIQLFGNNDLPKTNKTYIANKNIKNSIDKEAIELKRLQPVDVIDKVYRKFIELCGLDENHEKHLLEDRKLTDKEIIKGKFFTIQDPKTIISDLIKYVHDEGLVLNGVPGFYQRKYYNKWVWNYNFYPKKDKAMGIPVFNEKGLIIGIQYRFETKTENGIEKTYVWFSSNKHLLEQEKSRNGMSINVPIGHIQSDSPTHSVFITEGTFKGLCLSKHTRMNGLILSGVGAQKDVVSELEKSISLVSQSGQVVKNIFIAFDADFKRNFSVYSHMKRLYETISENFKDLNIVIMDWDIEFGKGIDDLINNNKIKSVKRVIPLALIKLVNKYSKELPNQKNLKANKPEDVENMFNKIFNEIENS